MRYQILHKINYFHAHLNVFLLKLGVVSYEHGERRFYQNITKMGSNYQSQWNSNMMEGFCWMFLYNILEAKYTRSSKKPSLLIVCLYYDLYCIIQVI